MSIILQNRSRVRTTPPNESPEETDSLIRFASRWQILIRLLCTPARAISSSRTSVVFMLTECALRLTSRHSFILNRDSRVGSVFEMHGRVSDTRFSEAQLGGRMRRAAGGFAACENDKRGDVCRLVEYTTGRFVTRNPAGSLLLLRNARIRVGLRFLLDEIFIIFPVRKSLYSITEYVSRIYANV